MPEPRPRYVAYHLTERCDARCRHCRIWQRSPWIDVDAERLCRSAREIAEWLGPREIQIAGGEPLLATHLIELVTAAHDAGLSATMSTNGFSLTGDMANTLARAGLAVVSLSLDGFDHVHTKMRGRPDAFSLAQRAISHAHDNGLAVHINCLLCEANLDILPGFVDWISQDARLGGIFFQAMVQPFGEPPAPDWWRDNPLFPHDAARAAATIAQLRDMKRAGFPILNADEQLAMMADYFADPAAFARARCRVGDFGVTIGGDGNVILCGRCGPIGRLQDDVPMRDLYLGDRAQAVRRRMADCRENCHLLINCCFIADSDL